MRKDAVTRFPVHELIRRRYSARAIEERPVEREKIGSLMEAARWAPSSFNEQPWRFVLATRDDEDAHRRLAECMLPFNRAWAAAAPVLILTLARRTFTHNGKPNRHAFHDVGLAVENLVLQAESLHLTVHQLGGFDPEKARELFSVPDGFDPVTMLAVGYRGDPRSLPDELREKELAPRERKPLERIVFGGRFGEPWFPGNPGGSAAPAT